jgi:outer membrane beta-barrel protein
MRSKQKSRFVYRSIVLASLILQAAYASESLEDSLKALDTPGNQAPSVVADEKLYAVQDRYAPLRNVNEIGLSASRRFFGSSFLNTNEVGLNYRFHFSNRFSLGLGGTYVFNEFTLASEQLLLRERILPDIAYVKYTADLLAAYNVFYGKFRLSMDRVFYFDNYIAIGPGLIFFEKDKTWAAVGDIGFVFWLGKWTSVRIGLKDHYYHEKRRLSESNVHNIIGHMSLGIVL